MKLCLRIFSINYYLVFFSGHDARKRFTIGIKNNHFEYPALFILLKPKVVKTTTINILKTFKIIFGKSNFIIKIDRTLLIMKLIMKKYQNSFIDDLPLILKIFLIAEK